MTITSKGRTNYAKSLINDKRTAYRRSQKERSLDISQIVREMKARPEPLYKEGDQILLADGTRRKIVSKTYSNSQKTWQFKITTAESNRWGGSRISPNYTEREIINMDTSQTQSEPNLSDNSDKWIVQFKSGSEASDYQSWVNSDGKVALFDHDMAIYFAQQMIMAHDAKKQWAIFRVRPYIGYEGQQTFFTLIQPDGKYTAAIAHESGRQQNLTIHLYDEHDIVPLETYSYDDTGSYFLRHLTDAKWILESKDDVVTYVNPVQPIYDTSNTLVLPTGLERAVKFVTPYWVSAGQVGFKYWFYIQDKQLVSYTEAELSKPASIEAQIDALPSFYDDPKPEPAQDIRQRCIITKVEEIPIAITIEQDTRIAELEAQLKKAEQKLKLMQHKEIQYENLRKNEMLLIKALRQHAPDDWKSVVENLHETNEYDKMAGPIMMENMEMKGEIAELERKNNRLHEVLHDIDEAARKQEGDNHLDSLWGWIGYMANCGWQGAYYSDWVKAKFDKPQTNTEQNCKKEQV